MIVAVMQVTPDGDHEVATFVIGASGTVIPSYAGEHWRLMFESDGIWTPAAGVLTPRDGQRFLDALPLAFANSSTIRVTVT